MSKPDEIAIADAEAKRREHIDKAMQALDIVRDELWKAWQTPTAGSQKHTGMLAAWHEMICQMWYWLRPMSSKADTK